MVSNAASQTGLRHADLAAANSSYTSTYSLHTKPRPELGHQNESNMVSAPKVGEGLT